MRLQPAADRGATIAPNKLLQREQWDLLISWWRSALLRKTWDGWPSKPAKQACHVATPDVMCSKTTFDLDSSSHS